MSKRGVLVALFAYNARLLYLGNALVTFESQPEHRTLGIVLAHYLYFLSNAERCPPLGKLLLLNFALAWVRARTALMFVYTRHFLYHIKNSILESQPVEERVHYYLPFFFTLGSSELDFPTLSIRQHDFCCLSRFQSRHVNFRIAKLNFEARDSIILLRGVSES